MIKKIKKGLGLVLLFIGLPFAQVSAKEPVDAVIIMDSSGSMKKTDPNNLRKPAAKLFISLLGIEDRVSVMSFSDNAYPITYLLPLDDDKNLERSLQATDKVSSKGVYTNIHAAINRAHDILIQDQSGHQQMIILLSDGQMDVGNDEKSFTLTMQLQDDLIPKLNAANIKVYSIAFTEASDQALLTSLADNSGGFCKVAQNDSELHLAFTSIFEQSKQPDMLPLTENRFVADASIREITIVASKETAESRIFLEDPDANRFEAVTAPDNMKWFVSDSFDMITVKQPSAGEWKILFSDNNNKAYIVADISMQTKFEFIEENQVEKMQALAWLTKDDETITQADILDNLQVNIEIVNPNDKITPLPLGRAIDDVDIPGVFRSVYTPDITGTYFATITAKSQTFERQQTFSFRATAPDKPPEPVPEPEPVPTPAPVIEQPAETPPAAPAPQPVEEPEQESDTLQSILLFFAMNIVLAIIGLIVYLVIKMRKQKAAAAQQQDK